VATYRLSTDKPVYSKVHGVETRCSVTEPSGFYTMDGFVYNLERGNTLLFLEGFMFHITILAVGRLKEKYLANGAAEYLKRLSAYARVEVVEVNDEGFAESLSPLELVKVKEREGERLLKRLRQGTFLIALDLRGKPFSSEEMAEIFGKNALEGKGDMTFIIGGALGLSQKVLERADLRISFSRLTFPHQLMRIILLEQIYRWFKIHRREPYHY